MSTNVREKKALVCYQLTYVATSMCILHQTEGSVTGTFQSSKRNIHT